jgi:hypothetical protein
VYAKCAVSRTELLLTFHTNGGESGVISRSGIFGISIVGTLTRLGCAVAGLSFSFGAVLVAANCFRQSSASLRLFSLSLRLFSFSLRSFSELALIALTCRTCPSNAKRC